MTLCLPDAAIAASTDTHTGCKAIYDSTNGYKSPADAPAIECPTAASGKPCPPSNCTAIKRNDDGTITANGCGPITFCIVEGEDPPISSPLWGSAPEEAHPFILSGKCKPPSAGVNPLTSWSLNCPASVNTTIPSVPTR